MTDYSPSTRPVAHRETNVSVKNAIAQKLNVMHAVIMRDIRSRFFNHGLGFLIVPLFPVTHVVVLLVFYKVIDKESAFGNDLMLFFATGLMPALTFTYLSRFMSISLLANKSMMAFPVVRLLDIVFARAFLEFIAIILALLIMFLFLLSFGSNPIPTYPSEALLAYLVTVLLALGFGIVASVITAVLPMFAMIYALSMAIFYLSSGAPIYLQVFPEQVVYLCSWNPVFHSVEWIRSAYYLGHSDQYLDKTYLVGCAFGSVAFGLLLERMLRPFVLNG